MPNSILDTKKAAAYLNLSSHTLDKWRWSGGGPKYLKLGRSIRYCQDALDRFISESIRHHTSEGAQQK